MARAESRFVCQSCGAMHPKWAGKCDDCGAWNTLVEEASRVSAPKGLGGGKGGRPLHFFGLQGDAQATARRA
ncbi:MAG: DNA repair protein RadA, partial [Stellaceae bacterium]